MRGGPLQLQSTNPVIVDYPVWGG